MISLTFRIVMVLMSVLVMAFILKKVRDSKVRLEDAIFWFVFSLLLLIVSIFPQIFDVLSSLAGVYDRTNFVFLFFIFLLLVKVFTMSVRISQLDTKVKELTQAMAIERMARRGFKAQDKQDTDQE